MDQRILIIDGHPVYAHKTIEFLRGLSFTDIQLAKTGNQGIDEIRSKNPDLVILSSMLSDMDSLEACKVIHELTNGFAKIIIQIGLAIEVKMIKQFTDYGADVVLMRKEKDLQPLQRAIEELFLNKA